MLPREIFKIGLSKMQFPAFPGTELINREGLLSIKKCSQEMKYLMWQIIINSLRALVRFFSRFQNGFQSERVWDNPGYDRFTDGRGGGRGWGMMNNI